MGLNVSLTSDIPLHSASTIRILSSDPNKEPRILRRVRSNVVLDYHTYLTHYGIEGYSNKSNVLYGQAINEYREGFIIDYTSTLPDTTIESFDFIKLKEDPRIDNGKYRFILNVYLNNDEHTIGFYETDDTSLEPILEYTMEQYDGDIWNYKIVRFQSSNYTNQINLVNYTESLKQDETTKFDIGLEEIVEKHNIQSPGYIKSQLSSYNQFHSFRGSVHNKDNNIQLTHKNTGEGKIKIDKRDFVMGVNYPKGYLVEIDDLSFVSLVHNNTTHPFQSGLWRRI